LIKLVDATQDFSLTNAQVDADGDINYDPILNIYPKTKLCSNSAGNPKAFGKDAHGIGYCSNINPPGFYAVLYYDTDYYGDKPFRLYTRSAQDYSTTTQFYIFTTTGYLQLVSPHSGVFTQTASYTSGEAVASHYSSIVHVTNTTIGRLVSTEDYWGNIDCETNPKGSNGALDCVNKNDYLMFLTTSFNGQQATFLASNPVYPNIYQVKKIARNEKTFKTDPSNIHNEKIRHIIQLDMSLNSKHTYHSGKTDIPNDPDTTASIYKFYPPTNNAQGGYEYAAQCSNRGICNTDSGLCECFHGYTNDNCDTINALAV